MNKIEYLQTQNKHQQEQILQLKQLLKVNKIEIDILSAQLKDTQNKKLMDVIISYREREEKMMNTIKQLKKDIREFATDNLVLRQLNQGQNVEIRNMENLHLAAAEIFNKKIVQLENKLAFYDKTHKQYDKVSGFVLKNKQIVNPQQLAILLKNKQEEWKDEIAEMRCKVDLAKKSEQDLIIVNTVLRNKIISLQAQLAMPNKNLGDVLDKSLKKLMLYFIQVQKRIITGDDESDSDSENDLELIAPELTGIFPEKQLRIQRDYGVPHIDLLKIKEQMNNAGNKANEALRARNHLTDKQKIERLEIQLQYTRREMSRNIIDLREEKERRKKAEALARQLQARIDLLVASNQQLEAKVKKYWQKLKTEREKAYAMNENLDTGKGLVDEEPMHNLDQTLKLQPKKKNKNAGRQNRPNLANPSLLLNQYNIDYKIHLQILSKQLQKNPKLSHLSKLKPIKPQPQPNPNQPQQPQQPQRPMKRSTSNPLLYFNERKNEIMTVHEERGGHENNQRERLEQTCYNPGDIIGFEHVLDQFQDA